MLLFGDIQGNYLSFLALLKKCPDDDIVLLGDLIDRGPRSYEMVQYAIDNKVKCVMGNHEWMMIHSANKVSIGQDWQMNGGYQTVLSYPKDDFKTLNEHRKWMADLPIYLRFEDLVNADGRHLLATHTGVHLPFDDFLKHPDNLWVRYKHHDMPGVYNVHGHTTVTVPQIEKSWANIDTGCYKPKPYGYLTALRFPQMELYTQECIDFLDQG